MKLLGEMQDLPAEDMYIFRAFMPGGWLSKHLPNYKMREGQVRLAQRVDRSLRGVKSSLLAEGPTGIGKSLAYSLPLAYRSVLEDTKGVIVTANIALQEQLITKDLPILSKAVPWVFKHALFKGRNNYLCKEAYEALVDEDHMTRRAGKRRLQILAEQENNPQYLEIASWATQTETGDVSELSFEPSPKVWEKFSVTSEDCSKSACKHYKECFANQAYQGMSGANIIVTNYHIYFGQIAHDLGVNYGLVVFDEAHKMADIARDFFGFRINENSFRWLASRIHGEPFLKRNLEANASIFFADLRDHYESGNYRIRIRQRGIARASALVRSLQETEVFFRNKHKIASDNFEAASKDPNMEHGDKFRLQRMLFEAHRCLSKSVSLQMNVSSLDLLDEDAFVYSIEVERERLNVVARRFNIGEELRNTLSGWGTGEASASSYIFTSATLAVGGSFDHTMTELGLKHEDVDLFVAESPFDWVQQAKVIVPDDFTDPRDRESFRKQVGMALAYTVEQARGRTLGLFTSWAGLNEAYEVLKPLSKYRILKQGDMPRAKLIEAFKEDTSSVLLGVESFWQGIDVPGESLVCVVIDKLPFPSPDDPVLDALQSRWEGFVENHATAKGSPFETYSIPKMVLSVRQGFGRLIRSVSDRGVVVILDKRVHLNWDTYGRLLVNSLPPVAQSVDLDDVGRFLR